MSVTSAVSVRLPRRLPSVPLQRLAFGIVATLVVALGLMALGAALQFWGVVPASVPRNPFGMTLREAAPTTNGIGGLIIMAQAQFYAALTASVIAIKANGSGLLSLSLVGFLYGIFHAAGPGHGKALISSYVLSRGRSFSLGISLSVSAAFMQAISAILLISVLAIALNATTTTINSAAHSIELGSFGLIAFIGLLLVWWKAGHLTELFNYRREQEHASHPTHALNLQPAGTGDWREFIGIVCGAGFRPCTGAIILLIFSLSQGLFLAGVIGTFAMALGTAMTTGTIASFAVLGKGMLLKATSKRGIGGAITIASIELLAAAFILSFGVILYTGLWMGRLPSILD